MKKPADDGKWKRWLMIGGGGNLRRLLTVGGKDDKRQQLR